jgi:hypothetical protein
MNFAHRTVVPLVLQVGFVVECARIAAHVGPQQPSSAGEWATVVGGVLLAVVLAGAVALRVTGPGCATRASTRGGRSGSGSARSWRSCSLRSWSRWSSRVGST